MNKNVAAGQNLTFLSKTMFKLERVIVIIIEFHQNIDNYLIINKTFLLLR